MTDPIKTKRVHELTTELNRYRHEYYNLNAPTVTDKVYDYLFDELSKLENETGLVLANSPTQTVGYTPVSELAVVSHDILLLSLEKTKSIEETEQFLDEQPSLLMLKLDGLTVKMEYRAGVLYRASTRGDGEFGEDITHAIPAMKNVPLKIQETEDLTVTGEALIHRQDFERLNQALVDAGEDPYKNARCLAAGSVRCHDPAVCAERSVYFYAFNVIEGLEEIKSDKGVEKPRYKSARLKYLSDSGFDTCPMRLFEKSVTTETVEQLIDELVHQAECEDLPIDGIVATYNDIAVSKSCGKTGHHYKDGRAYKFEDESYETTLLAIDWQPSRTGLISPVAVFTPVEIDGCTVERASLFNVTFIKGRMLNIGCQILVSKRNQIIPYVEENLEPKSEIASIPDTCPCCGMPTKIKYSKKDKVETLHCENKNCTSRIIRKLVHFASKKAADIDGLSEATLEVLFSKGWVASILDLYSLNDYEQEFVALPGFGQQSYNKLWAAIEQSRDINFDRFLVCMDIPMIGKTASRTLSHHFNHDIKAFEKAVAERYDFTQLTDIGLTLHRNILEWFEEAENKIMWYDMQDVMNVKASGAQKSSAIPIAPPGSLANTVSGAGYFANKNIVVTGTIVRNGKHYTRSEVYALLSSLGATPEDRVTKYTDYVVVAEKPGATKVNAARDRGVPTLTVDEFFARL